MADIQFQAIVKEVAKRVGFNQKDVSLVIDTLLTVTKEHIMNCECVKLKWAYFLIEHKTKWTTVKKPIFKFGKVFMQEFAQKNPSNKLVRIKEKENG